MILTKSTFTAFYNDKFLKREIVNKLFNAPSSPGNTDRKYMHSARKKIKTYLRNGKGIYQSAGKKWVFICKTLPCPAQCFFNPAAF